MSTLVPIKILLDENKNPFIPLVTPEAVKVEGTDKDMYGLLQDVITQVEEMSTAKEDVINKVTSINANSTDSEYPSAACVYKIVGDIETLLQEI